MPKVNKHASTLTRLFIKRSLGNQSSQLVLRLNFILYAYISGLLVTALLLVSNIKAHNTTLIVADIFLITSILFWLVVLRFSAAYKLVFHGTVIVFAFLTAGVFLGNDISRAVIISPIVLMLAYFLLGARAGVSWTFGVLCSYGICYEFLVFTSKTDGIHLADAVTSGIILAFISTLLYVFGGSYEKAELLVRMQAEELEKSNDQLKAELNKNIGLAAKMQQVIDDTEKNNAVLEESKKALINVLEDSNELQMQLTQEKEGVEEKIKERTQQLQEEQARLRASIDTLDLGFLMTLPDGSSIMHNPALLDISGIGILEGDHKDDQLLTLLAKTIGKHFNLIAAVKKCQKTAKPFTVNDIALGTKTIRILGSAIQVDADSEPLGVVVLIQNMSAEKALDRSKDEFISIASHELRTPLTAIRGNISLLQMLHADVFNDKEVSEMMADINDSVIRLINIVNQFLTTSRLEQKKTVFQFSDVNVNKVIERVTGELRPMADEATLGLTLKLAKSLPAVKADESRLQGVINNLVGNAIKYSDTGTITVSTEHKAKSVIIRVADTGKGMDVENQKRLFHKFQQASDNILTRDDSRSTGLGLYITKLMMDQMGGSVELESSAVGKGSVFRVTLPVA